MGILTPEHRKKQRAIKSYDSCTVHLQLSFNSVSTSVQSSISTFNRQEILRLLLRSFFFDPSIFGGTFKNVYTDN